MKTSGSREGTGSTLAQVRQLREMTWQDVEGLDRESAVFFFVCGPVEQHGPQAPLGTDLYIAEHVMHECAWHLADNGHPVVVTPTVPYVNALFSLPYPGSVSIRRKVVEQYLFDMLASFASDGFEHLILTSQHVDPPWVRAAEGVCERVNEEYGARAIHGFERLVVDLLRDPSQLDLQGLDLGGEAHAGAAETGPMLHIQDRLVREHLLNELPPQPVEFPRLKESNSFREVGNGLGYTGDLSRSTREMGKKILAYYSARFSDLILRHVRGEDVHDALRFTGF
jgi:creatinine amidohydrolase/Fe(II)-dependent formamide hydrolase-like protein